MGKKGKFRWTFFYTIIGTYTCLMFRLFYRRLRVVGYEKIPANTPVIFAPNHQNALMDALAVVYASRRPVAFLARADIFQKPAVAKILNSFKMMPIYRMRDGIDSLTQNQEIFQDTVEVLRSNTPICILPEGNHEGRKRLRPLKKGIFRIAFQAEESSSYNLNLHIVPVGLDYSNYFKAGSDLLVVFGKPIKMSDYVDQYRENEQRTINKLRTVLANGISSVIIDIPEEHYELIYQICEIYEPNVWNTCNVKRHPYNKLTIRQYIIKKVTESFTKFPEKAEELESLLNGYHTKLNSLGLKDLLLQQKEIRFLPLFFEIILSLLFIPIQIYGTLLNYIPFKIPVMIAANVKDKHFQTSIHFAISMFLFPIYYLILIALFCLFTEDSMLRLVFVLTLPFSGFFAFYNYKHMKKLMGKLRLYTLRIFDAEKYKLLFSERNQIINLIKTTINS